MNDRRANDFASRCSIGATSVIGTWGSISFTIRRIAGTTAFISVPVVRTTMRMKYGTSSMPGFFSKGIIGK